MSIRILGIAINEYQDPVLDRITNCLNDLNEILGVLNSRYEVADVELLSNPEQTSRSFLYNRLYDYFFNCADTDSVMLLYNGHGQYNDFLKTSYWQTSDSDSTDASSWLNLSDIMDFIRVSPAFHVSIISNSCFSGAIFEENTRGGGIDALAGRRSRLALTAGGIEKVSDGKENSLSPFTETLVHHLSENKEQELLFTSLGHQVLMGFDPARPQTPMFGSLANVGHEGGSAALSLKNNQSTQPDFKEISLALNTGLPINIDYQCEIPLFNENEIFDSIFVNFHIQQIAFYAVGQIQEYLREEKDYLEEYTKTNGISASIHYTISSLTDDRLSIVIAVHTYFGGAYPNYYIRTLNIAYKPERLLELSDIFPYHDLQTFLTEKIDQYGADKEQKRVLHKYKEYIKEGEIEFSISEDAVTLYFTNEIPKAFKALGDLNFPL